MEKSFFPVTRREAERQGLRFSSAANKKAPFPSQLRKLRDEKGISQAALAKVLMVSKSTIGLWETGDTLPDAKSLHDIASYFGVSSDWLLGLAEEKSINGDLAQASRYTGLSEETVEKLHKGLSDATKRILTIPVISKLISSWDLNRMTENLSNILLITSEAVEEARNNISFEKNYFAKAEIFEGGKVMLSAADAKNFMIAQISQELEQSCRESINLIMTNCLISSLAAQIEEMQKGEKDG